MIFPLDTKGVKLKRPEQSIIKPCTSPKVFQKSENYTGLSLRDKNDAGSTKNYKRKHLDEGILLSFQSELFVSVLFFPQYLLKFV